MSEIRTDSNYRNFSAVALEFSGTVRADDGELVPGIQKFIGRLSIVRPRLGLVVPRLPRSYVEDYLAQQHGMHRYFNRDTIVSLDDVNAGAQPPEEAALGLLLERQGLQETPERLLIVSASAATEEAAKHVGARAIGIDQGLEQLAADMGIVSQAGVDNPAGGWY